MGTPGTQDVKIESNNLDVYIHIGTSINMRVACMRVCVWSDVLYIEIVSIHMGRQYEILPIHWNGAYKSECPLSINLFTNNQPALYIHLW